MAWGGRRLDSLLSDTLVTPDLEVTRDFLGFIFETSPTVDPQAYLPQRPMHPPPASPCLMSAFPPGCQEGLC